MTTRNHAVLLAAAVFTSGLTLAACGDVEAGTAEAGTSQGGYAEGYQPGRYAPALAMSVSVDSGIRAQMAKKAKVDALPGVSRVQHTVE